MCKNLILITLCIVLIFTCFCFDEDDINKNGDSDKKNPTTLEGSCAVESSDSFSVSMFTINGAPAAICYSNFLFWKEIKEKAEIIRNINFDNYSSVLNNNNIEELSIESWINAHNSDDCNSKIKNYLNTSEEISCESVMNEGYLAPIHIIKDGIEYTYLITKSDNHVGIQNNTIILYKQPEPNYLEEKITINVCQQSLWTGACKESGLHCDPEETGITIYNISAFSDLSFDTTIQTLNYDYNYLHIEFIYENGMGTGLYDIQTIAVGKGCGGILQVE